MKTLITFSALLIFSTSAMAGVFSETLNCTSQDNKIELVAKLIYSATGTFSATSNYNGIELKSIQDNLFHTLQGWSGDIDNNRTIQVTFTSENKTAVLIDEEKVDRMGYTTIVTQLSCR